MEPKVMPEAAAVAELVKELHEAKLISVATGDPDAAQILIVPKGMQVLDVKPYLDKYRTAPERRTGIAELTELDSFIDHVGRFQDEDSALFADRTPSAPSLLCVFDYHRANDFSDDKADVKLGAARFGHHRARYAFPLSEEWKAWTASNAKPMTQRDFAAFLEDRIADVLDPIGEAGSLDATKKTMEALHCTFASPATLLDLSRGLAIRVDSLVVSQQNLKSGESVLRFETQHTDERGAPLNVPGAFLIGLPVFRNGDRYTLAARLRYRHRDGKVTWHYDLYRANETFDHAIDEACKTAVEQTTLPLFMGKPEA